LFALCYYNIVVKNTVVFNFHLSNIRLDNRLKYNYIKTIKYLASFPRKTCNTFLNQIKSCSCNFICLRSIHMRKVKAFKKHSLHGEKQRWFYWNCSSIVMEYVTPLTLTLLSNVNIIVSMIPVDQRQCGCIDQQIYSSPKHPSPPISVLCFCSCDWHLGKRPLPNVKIK